jgi:hypothetical protein
MIKYAVFFAACLQLAAGTSTITSSETLTSNVSPTDGGKSFRKIYRATPLGRKALKPAKSNVRELFGELIEGE